MMMMMMRWRRRRMRRGRRRMRTTTIMTWWMLSMSMGWHGLAILIYDWLKVIPPDEAKRTLIRKIQTAYCTKVRTQRKGLMFFGLQPLPQLPQVCASLIGFLNLVAKKKHKRKKPWPCIVFEARSGLLKMLAAFSARLVLTWHSFIFWTSESLEADWWTFWWFSSQCKLRVFAIFH